MDSKLGLAIGGAAAATLVIAVVLVVTTWGGAGGGAERWMTDLLDEGPSVPHIAFLVPSIEAFLDEDEFEAPVLARVRSAIEEALGEDGQPTWREIGVDPAQPVGLFFNVADDLSLATFGAIGSDDEARDAFHAHELTEAINPEASTHAAAGLTWRCIAESSLDGLSTSCITARDGRMRMASWFHDGSTADIEGMLERTTPPAGDDRYSQHPMMREALRLPEGALVTALISEEVMSQLVDLGAEYGSSAPMDLGESRLILATGLYVDGDDVEFIMRSHSNWHELPGGFSYHPEGRDMGALLDLPSPTLASTQLRIPFEDLYDFMLQNEALFHEFGLTREDFERSVSSQERALGLSLRDDLFASLNSDYLFAIHDPTRFLDFDLDAPTASLRLGLADVSRTEELLDRLIGIAETRGVTVTQHSTAGSTFHTFDADLGAPLQIGIHAGALWVAVGDTVLSRTMAGDLPQMRDDPQSAHVQYMTSTGQSAAMFIELSQLLAILPEFGVDFPGMRALIDAEIDLRFDITRERAGLYNTSLRITNATAIFDTLDAIGF